MPLIGRDEIKTRTLHAVGWGDREWSKKIGQASYAILDYILAEFAKSKSSFIIESDFNPHFANEKFQRVCDKHGYEIIQLICHAERDILIQRWQERAAKDAEHPSSTEGSAGYADLVATLDAGEREPLEVPGTTIHIDTSSPNPDYPGAIIELVRKLL